jgi:hypothetical protein
VNPYRLQYRRYWQGNNRGSHNKTKTKLIHHPWLTQPQEPTTYCVAPFNSASLCQRHVQSSFSSLVALSYPYLPGAPPFNNQHSRQFHSFASLNVRKSFKISAFSDGLEIDCVFKLLTSVWRFAYKSCDYCCTSHVCVLHYHTVARSCSLNRLQMPNILSLVVKGVCFPVNGMLMGELNWSAAFAGMCFANVACFLALQQQSEVPTMRRLWTAWTFYYLAQSLVGVTRFAYTYCCGPDTSQSLTVAKKGIHEQ